MLPDAAVGRVDHTGPVVVAVLDDLLGDELVQLEGRQGRDLGREVVVARAFAADGGDGQDEVADLGGLLQPAALAEKQDAFGLRARSAGP